MNEQTEIERIKYEIYDLATMCKGTIAQKKQLIKNEKKMKEELRKLFLALPEENQKDKFKNDSVEVSAKFPKSFDQELFKMENPGLINRYFKNEIKTVTTTTETFNKKKLEKDYPEIYEEYMKALTPSITIK